MKKLFLLVVVLFLSACGGGSGGGDTGSQVPLKESVLGGTPSSPTFLSFDSKNVINSNTFNNYFKYEGVAGERLVIRVNLNMPISDTEYSRCRNNPNTYKNIIRIYNSSNVGLYQICGNNLTYTLPENGLYILNFDFDSNRFGFFNAASLKGDNPVNFLDIGSGSPNQPKKLDIASTNSIESNIFLNYYWISAAKGETIIVNAKLNQSLSDTDKNRCRNNPNTFFNGIRVYNNKLSQVGFSCDETIRFEVPENGNYILHFNYESQSPGLFNAAKI